MNSSPKKKFILYTYKFDIHSIPDFSVFQDYDTIIVELENNVIPDIVLDDPGFFLVGLTKEDREAWEYMDYIRDQKLDMVVFLFVEEEDFDTLKLAIDHHVDEVLVGGIEEHWEEFEKKVKKCIKKIQSLVKIRRNFIRLEELHFEKKQRIMGDLLTNALKDPKGVETQLQEVNAKYNTNIGMENFIVLVISCDRYELLAETPEFVKRVTLLVLYHMRSSREIICNRRDPYGLVVVMNIQEDYTEFRLHNDLMLLYMAIKNLKEEFGEFDLSIGVGPRVKRIDEIAKSLTEASMAQEFRMFSDERILYANGIKGVNRNWNQYVSASLLGELGRYVAIGDETSVQEWFRFFYEELEEELKEYPPAYARLCWECYNFCLDLNSPSFEMFPEKKFFSLQNMFKGHERIQKLESILLEICHMIKNGTSHEQQIAVPAIAYMKVHYAEPLNLETLAENCGVSPSYFSRKFKEETGEKYIEALTDIRILEAERLLEETNDSVNTIMEKVGYLDDKHFRRVFSERTGVTPSQYRKKIKRF